jgi:Flp pilus assembly protein TadD
MSLMNDALRKKKTEKKHPSGTDFLKDDSGKKTKRKVVSFGIAAIVLLACVMAGFYLYEMMSLSEPMAPGLPSPRLAEKQVNPPQEPNTQVQDGNMPVSPESPASTDAPQVKQTAPSKITAAKPSVPAPKPEGQKASPAAAPLKEAVSKTLEARQEPSAPKKVVDIPSTIEPEMVSPQTEPAGKTALIQKEEAAPAVPKDTETVAELFYRKGLSYHRQNKLEMAIQMYQSVLKKNPNHRSTRFNLASAYIQVAAFTEAGTLLEELNRQEPENPEIRLNLAAVKIGLDDPEQALTLLESAERETTAPTFEILFHKGAAYSRMGDFETALGMYRKAERLAPENPRLWLNTAIAYDNLAQYDRAVDHYQVYLDRKTSLTITDRREIETRVRKLKAYLAQQTDRPTAGSQTESGQTE